MKGKGYKKGFENYVLGSSSRSKENKKSLFSNDKVETEDDYSNKTIDTKAKTSTTKNYNINKRGQ